MKTAILRHNQMMVLECVEGMTEATMTMFGQDQGPMLKVNTVALTQK
jgi:hypothetical protein